MTSLDPTAQVDRTAARPLVRGAHWGAALIGLLIVCGVLARVAPLFDEGGRMLRQFPTEDGYLMLTIARNFALGLGMSTAAGTMPTNGMQPLTSLLFAGLYRLVGADKSVGALLVQVYSLAVACLTAWLLYRFGARLLRDRPQGRLIAAVAAAAWFASPLGVRHTMNCLETGTYALLTVVAVSALVASWHAAPKWSAARCIGLGALLGLVFWARNDAVFLIFAACAVRAGSGLWSDRALLGRRVAEAVLLGLTSVLVAAPWLAHNQLRFGSIMPISGQAESIQARFAGNLPAVPAVLADYLTVMVQIPRALEQHRAVIAAAAALVIVALALLAATWRRATPPARTAIVLVSVYALGLLAFYGLFFGAAYFMGRYLFPLSGFIALLVTVAVLTGAQHLPGALRSRALPVVGAATLLLAIGLNARIYRHGTEHQHFQVVRWVQAHVPADTWVGATQTGTLGYFHDRTINLDGKVNPAALAALKRDAVPQYILNTKIEYLADWVGIAGWAELPVLRPHFTVVVRDEQHNLGVLRRVDAPL